MYRFSASFAAKANAAAMKIAHLQMIQGVVSRMAGNSATLKGWAVTRGGGIVQITELPLLF
jgi:hypothetical protein